LDILLFQEMLDAINASLITILPISKTVHRCILRSTHSNCNSAKLNFLSPDIAPQQSRA